MRRAAPILLCLALLALGSGLLRAVHEHAHELSDRSAAHGDCLEHSPATGGHDPAPPHHDENNCDLHAMLRAPIVSAAAPALVVCLGLLTVGPAPAAIPLVSRRQPMRCDCRGPPVR